MGKIVKYCTKCEEGFAAKFGFCPNCGEHLEAFEMNPIQEAAAPVAAETVSMKNEVPVQDSFATLPRVEEPVVPAPVFFSNDNILQVKSADVIEETEEEAPETDTFIAEPVQAESNGNGYQQQFVPEAHTTQNYSFTNTAAAGDDFHVTVIEAKDVRVRNGLLLGFGSLFFAAMIVAWVWALFVANLPVFALDEQGLSAFVGPINDTPVEIEKPPKKNDDDGGGGGGGGKDNPIPVNQGRLPTQMENPPNQLLTVSQMTKPEFLVQNATKGNIKREMTDQPIGLPNGLSADTLSGGPGSGGGIGGGKGNGAGGGIGDGEGNGNGSGSGNGNGNGNGDGDGDGDNDGPQITKVEKPVGVTAAIKILSRPQPRYTDPARQNNVQGTVTLKVTFLANGSIGGVSPVSGLPYGLTEQAIAAAKQIRFEPAKKNGVAITVNKTVSYTFTIY